MAAVSKFLHKTDSAPDIFNDVASLLADLNANNLSDNITVFAQGKDDTGPDSVIWSDATWVINRSGGANGTIDIVRDPATTGVPLFRNTGGAQYSQTNTSGSQLTVTFDSCILSGDFTAGNDAWFFISHASGNPNRVNLNNCYLPSFLNRGAMNYPSIFETSGGATATGASHYVTNCTIAITQLDTILVRHFFPHSAASNVSDMQFRNNIILLYLDSGETPDPSSLDLFDGVGSYLASGNRVFNYGTMADGSILRSGTDSIFLSGNPNLIAGNIIGGVSESAFARDTLDARPSGTSPVGATGIVDVPGLINSTLTDVDGKPKPLGPSFDVGYSEFGIPNASPTGVINSVTNTEKPSELTFSMTIDDADDDPVDMITLELDAAGSFGGSEVSILAKIVSGQTSQIDTSSGAVTTTYVADVQDEVVQLGDSSTYKIRAILNDGTADSDAILSSSFSMSNSVPPRDSTMEEKGIADMIVRTQG